MKSLFLALAVFAVAIPALSQEPQVDLKAKAALTEMVAAYRTLRTLSQETSYASAGSDLGRLIKSRLVVQKPNKFLLEITERTAERAQPVIRRYQCDGKNFYSYFEARSVFTMDKAPKDFSGFSNLTTNLEMAALAGVDPFASLSKQARSVKLLEPSEAGAMPVDVVSIDISDDFRTGEARFYIGTTDRLLRRFSFDTKPIVKPEPPKQEPMLDENGLPIEPPLPPKPIHFEYENKVEVNKDPGKDTFRWIAPPGAFLQRDDPMGYLDQRRKDQQRVFQVAKPIDLFNPTDPKDLSKPTKKIHASDLIKKATREKK